MHNPHLFRMLLGALLSLALTACGSGQKETGSPVDSVFTGVNFVGVAVSDIERSVQMYQETVNLQPTAAALTHTAAALDAFTGGTSTPLQTQLMRGANAQLLFMEFASPPALQDQPGNLPVYGPGIAHVCYQVNKETQSYARFLDAGATPIGDPNMVTLNPKNPVQYAYARDLDGTVVEIEHVDIAALDLPEPPKNDYRIRHVSLATADIDRLVAFYSILLAQEKPRRAGRFIKLSGDKLDRVSGLPNSKIEMAWFQLRNLELEIIQYHSHPTDPAAQPRPIDALGYNMIVLDVSDLAAARQRVEAAGGTMVGDSHTSFGGETIFARDPDGNLLGMQAVDASHAMSSENFSGNGT